jgi:hypothetical protein
VLSPGQRVPDQAPPVSVASPILAALPALQQLTANEQQAAEEVERVMNSTTRSEHRHDVSRG